MWIFAFITFLILLIFFSAFLSCSETAIFSLSAFTVRNYQNSKDSRKRIIAKLLQNPRELLVTVMMLNVLANILVQNTVASLFGEFSSWFLNVGIPLGLTLIFGEILPKSIALPNNYAISKKIAPVLHFLNQMLKPLQKVLTKLTSYISRFLFFFLKKEPAISPDELKHILKTSKEMGVLKKDEVKLTKGYLNLELSTVKEHMRPKEEVIFYDINQPLDKLLHILVEKECSRVPICDRDLENILGVISTRRLFFYYEKITKPQDLKEILRKPLFVAESMNAWILLTYLRKQQENLALVVDEYGSISGLITQEDLIEVIIGEIVDLRDIKTLFTHPSKDVVIASGKLELNELEEIFDIELQNESNVVTVGGWLTQELGDIPKVGTKYTTNNLLFYILAAEPNRVKRVYIRRLRPKGKK